MIDELKSEIEKTFNKKIINRGDCEDLAQAIYEQNGIMLSYNTLRRLFGLAENRKIRESSLDLLARYCGYQSYEMFCRRFAEKDSLPTWEHLFMLIAQGNTPLLIKFLITKKKQRDNFTISLAICLRELIRKRDLKSLMTFFQEPAFQFSNLTYDDVLQIGVIVGVGFREFSDDELESNLLLEPNFRNLVVKIFVDYGRLFGKYGKWIDFLSKQKNLDVETVTFIACIKTWQLLLANEQVEAATLERVPNLAINQHPILFGRIFGIKMLTTNSTIERRKLINSMRIRIKKEPHLMTELLYEPRFQCIVFPNTILSKSIEEFEELKSTIKLKYHFSHAAIYQVLQVSLLIKKKQYLKANNQLLNIDQFTITHSYQEIIEVYSSFFQLVLAKKLEQKNVKKLENQFNEKRQIVTYPLFTDAYFETYFDE
ncbi:MAG: hypothetical protein RIT10_621 [Bacteroidota bacterium]|jgi:hypothetical protein